MEQGWNGPESCGVGIDIVLGGYVFFWILRGWEKSKITLTIKKKHVNEMIDDDVLLIKFESLLNYLISNRNSYERDDIQGKHIP